MRLFLVALQFLTRLPVRLSRFEPAWLNDCVRHFPGVGMVVGAIGAVVLAGAALLWPAWIAAVLALAATVALTGGFHEDGLADTFDALGGVVPRDKALAIMKDSRIGSYGALALGLSLLLRAALLAVLAARPLPGAVAALLASHAFARAAAVGVMVSLPYGGDADHAKAKPLALAVAPRNFGIALAWCGLLALALGLLGIQPAHLLLAFAATAAVAWAMQRWLKRRLGGYTGDGLGATEQLAEIAVLLAFTASF
ncbi:adenosylcobinamide-GDP ribazoletransferase [Roseateles saccharophilus]|uniref:Adenosylcobinamide-GDP ribazoletransferase n=1 Tax=Roseateles saccharophilus TaxID=304 RepID=A0A4R3VCI2_ROSSA|nr:adenosylcobinamide-GDP ribazoletransferase [Roseateles saccharophilus]MDG0832608.1 adenosylcobinamide-GDP ribazoletransferase [Roseateles saccharophilus]TCV00345.1 cobalamin-5'-phosphate synthase [Roseateles saccharophilus]